MSIQRVIELQQELSKSNDRVKELEAVVSSQAKEIEKLKNCVDNTNKTSNILFDKGMEQAKIISDLQQRLDKAVEIIKSYQKCNDIGDGYGCCNLIQAECIDKFLEANPLNTSQVVDTASANSVRKDCTTCGSVGCHNEDEHCLAGYTDWTPKSFTDDHNGEGI